MLLTHQSRAALQTCSCVFVGECRQQERSCQASRLCTGPECLPSDLGPTRQYATPHAHNHQLASEYMSIHMQHAYIAQAMA